MLQRGILRVVSTRRVAARSARKVATVKAVSNWRSYSQAVVPKLEKTTTGLCGLDVQPQGREILTKLYENLLVKLSEMEPTAPYRVYMTRVLNHRLDILRTTENVLDIEAKIEDGQIEELIEDAEGELEMLPSYIAAKLWQTPKWHTTPVVWSNLKD